MVPTVAADGSSRADRPRTHTVRLDNERERWRWRCPNNHTSWTPINGFVYCHACADQHGVDPVYNRLMDKRSGDVVDRAHITFR